MQQHKLKSRVLSFILMLAMIFTMIPSTAFAGSTDINSGTEGGSGGAIDGNWVWNGNQQFIRASIFFAPEGNWDSGKVEQIGYTVDLAHPNTAKARNVVVHGKFIDTSDSTFSLNNAKVYSGGVSTLKLGNYGYDQFYRTYSDNETGGPSIPTGTMNYDTGEFTKTGTMEFPILIGEKGNGVDAKAFFEQYKAWNALLWYTQQKKYGSAEQAASQGAGWQNARDMDQGIFHGDYGSTQYGQYIIVLEPGIYATVNGQYAALTVREAVLFKDKGSNIFSKISSPFRDLANKMFIKKNWPMLGLNGEQGVDQVSGKSWVGQYHDLIMDKFGVGIIEFNKVTKPAMPVLKYFYDFTTGSLESTEYFDKAVNIKEVPTGSTYQATATEDGYQLYGASVLSKSEIKGNLHQVDAVNETTGAKGKTTQFLNALDKSAVFTNEASSRVKEKYQADSIHAYIDKVGILLTNDVKNWGVANSFVTTLGQASKVSGLKSINEILKFNSDGTLSFNSGKGVEDLQLTLLYVKGNPPPPPEKTVNPSDPPIEIFRKGNTTVTKQYYDDPTSQIPTKIVTESIPKESTYTIKDEDPYKVKEWVVVDDKTAGQPEDYKDWETVKNNESEPKDGIPQSGTTTGDKGPVNWNDPDRELFIKYDKVGEIPEQPEVEGNLRLTEKRISWLKSLEHIGGIPTINFTWADITGSETHYCGSEHCGGHSCNERIGKDSFLRFVSSNTTSVNSVIMGNKPSFMPYDINNVHEFNRGNSGGTYNMTPNYG